MTPKATFTAASTVETSSIDVDLSTADAGDVVVLFVGSLSVAGRTDGSWSLSEPTLWTAQHPAPTSTSGEWGGAFAFVVPATPGTVTATFSASSSAGWMQATALTYAAADIDSADPVVDGALDVKDVANTPVALFDVDTSGVDGAVFVGAAFRRRSAGHTYTGLTEQVDFANTNPGTSDQTRMSAATVTLGTGGLHGSSYTIETSESTLRSTRLLSVALRPSAADQLDTPTGFTFTKTAGTAEVTGSWDSVTDAASYDYEVEEWDGSVWQPFALSSVTAPTTTFTLDDTDGVQFSTLYRARVRAVPAA